MYIEQLYTSCLAEAAYYIESNGRAAIIDPLRETEPYLTLAKKRGAQIDYVFETHFHADFVSGHIDLARKTGAKIIFGPLADTDYPVYNAKDNELFMLGNVAIKALHTPGHTPESTCYLLKDEEGTDHALFTGDTLFVGDVGRPDLLDGVMTKEELAGMMYDSLNEKIKPLADEVIVYPAHGPGSACGKNIGKETYSTIGIQKKTNYALQKLSKQDFIYKVTEGMLPPPKYFFDDARINKKGYQSIEQVLSVNNAALDNAAFTDEMEDGALILDTRHPDEFEKGFIKGSINIGLNGQYAVWVGSLIDINQKLILVTEPGKEEESILRLARVGYENVRGFLKGGIDHWRGGLDKIKSVAAADLDITDNTSILDVRKPGEYDNEHVKNAKLVTLGDMPVNLKDLDKEKAHFVHCAGGYRSMIASSIMKREGFLNPINVYGGFGAIKAGNVPVEKGALSI